MFGLFGEKEPPDIPKLKEENDVKGLIKALHYNKDPYTIVEAIKALEQLSFVDPVQSSITNLELRITRNHENRLVRLQSIETTRKHAVKHFAFYTEVLVSDYLEVYSKVQNHLTNMGFSLSSYIGDDLFVYENFMRVITIDSPQVLYDALNDSDSSIRASARKGIDEITEIGEIDLIKKLVDANDWWSKSQSTKILGAIKSNKSINPLINQLRISKEKQIRINIIEALGNIGDPQAIPALNDALKDKKRGVRKSAEKALKKINY